MSDERTFLKTSHGALHHPSCPNVGKLKLPTTAVVLFPADLYQPWRTASWVAQCCSTFGRVDVLPTYVWVEVDDDE